MAGTRGVWEGPLVRVPSTAIALAILLSVGTQGATAASPTEPEGIAKALADDPVYAHPRADPGLRDAQAGRLRLRIVRRKIGRIKIAVVPAEAAERLGGVAALANAIDRRLRARGTLVVVAGPSIYAVVSYDGAPQAVAALRRAVATHRDDGLAAQLLDAVDRIARIDPGPDADVGRQGEQIPGSAPNLNLPSAGGDDIVDDFLGTIRLGFLLIVAAILLPFVALGIRAWVRSRRGRAEEAEVLGEDWAAARGDLIALGEEIRALDLDVSMPGADQAGVAEYERALTEYERADQELGRPVTRRRLARVTAALAEGRRRIEGAKTRLAGSGVTPDGPAPSSAAGQAPGTLPPAGGAP